MYSLKIKHRSKNMNEKIKTKKYQVILKQTIWDSIEIDATDLEDADKIAEEKSYTYCGGGDSFDESGWEVSDVVEVQS